jgi:hypothetical protein
MSPKRVLLILAGLALLAYLPLFQQPLLEDDYPNIVIARDLGLGILTHPLFSVRSTGMLLLGGIHALFGMRAAAYYAAVIAIHVLNTWLVYALGQWPPIGYRVSMWAAVFFAVHEGHQEAIMWASSVPEPLQFLFGVGALAAWIRFLHGGRNAWIGVALLSFTVALFSKESAVIVLPLLALPLIFDRGVRGKAAYLIPFAALAGLGVLRILNTRAYSFRFTDGSFSLHAPFWLIWPVSFWRLFWFWGLAAILAILIVKPPRWRRTIGIGVLWAGIGLAPYSFLTYSLRIPSRQTYLASAGVALVVGSAFAAAAEQRRARPWIAVAAGVLIVHNVGYLWTKKRAQFLERAAPTERLIELARATQGPIYIRCFPRPGLIADAAVELMAGRKDLIWDAAQSQKAAATFCYTEIKR